MTDASNGRLPYGWRWQHVIPALGLVVGVLALLLNARGQSHSAETSANTKPTTTTPGGGAAAPSPTLTTSTAIPSPPGSIRLGHEVLSLRSEACHSAGSAEGSAWEVGPVEMGKRPRNSGYFCHIFAAATGNVEFVLGTVYRELRVSIGFADDSSSVQHTVRFEVVGDEKTYLVPPKTLHFGESADLVVDVSHTARLKLQVTELSKGGGDDASSKPVWVDPVLLPA